MILCSDHVSNFLELEGQLPHERPRLLAEIEQALHWPEERFRPPTEKLVGLGL